MSTNRRRSRKAEQALLAQATDALSMASVALFAIYTVLEEYDLTGLTVQFEGGGPLTVEHIYTCTMAHVRPINLALDSPE